MEEEEMVFEQNGNKWAWFNADRTARFALAEVGKNTVVCFGINPSKATPYKYDETIKSVCRIAPNASNRYDSFIMLNIYPHIDKNPYNLPENYSPALKSENEKHIVNIMKELSANKSQTLTLWAAWGDLTNKRKYLPALLRDIVQLLEPKKYKWVVLDMAKYSPARHPLYVASDTSLEPFDIQKYMAQKFNLFIRS